MASPRRPAARPPGAPHPARRLWVLLRAVAYTWFNRFAALRYMELHDYLGHGHRVLSSATAGLPTSSPTPDLAASRELPVWTPPTSPSSSSPATRTARALYRLLLSPEVQRAFLPCPFSSRRIDDETELLLPDNLLLHCDSVIAKLVAGIPEEDWAEVEIIGWLYQFYISEKRTRLSAKCGQRAGTSPPPQLFTPTGSCNTWCRTASAACG